MAFCMECGTELPRDAAFCEECGTKVEELSPAPTPSSAKPAVEVNVGAVAGAAARSDQYYAVLHGERSGPFSGEELRVMAEQGSLLCNTLIWRDGMAEWVEAASVTELSAVIDAIAVRHKMEEAAAAAQKKAEAEEKAKRQKTEAVQKKAAASVSRPAASPAQFNSGRRYKTILTAYILFFFVGIFGGHQFYLQNKKAGCLRLGLFAVFVITGWFGDLFPWEWVATSSYYLSGAVALFWLKDLFMLGKQVKKANEQ